MFAAACATAREFTRPVIILSRSFDGRCSASIGAFIIINEEGWIATAHHIFQNILDLDQAANSYISLTHQRKAIEDDASLKPGEKHRRLKAIPIPPNAITHYFVWWGMPGVSVPGGHYIKEVDLFVGKANNFDRANITTYPKFKDPSKAMELGRSLCKLGYPFFPIEPTFDVNNNSFDLPTYAAHPPFFPLEGIFTRQFQIPPVSAQPPAFPYSILGDGLSKDEIRRGIYGYHATRLRQMWQRPNSAQRP